MARALRGGYPEAVHRDPGRRRARFFDSYVTDLVTRDVQQISDIERPAVIGIEVKSAETVRGEDFRGLRHLANRLGDRFRAGIVLYAGEQQLSFGDRLTALPMAALWMLDGSAL